MFLRKSDQPNRSAHVNAAPGIEEKSQCVATGEANRLKKRIETLFVVELLKISSRIQTASGTLALFALDQDSLTGAEHQPRPPVLH
jgi:hypothetical protein